MTQTAEDENRGSKKKRKHSFERTVAYLLGIAGCASNFLGVITSAFFSLKSGHPQAILFGTVPTFISFCVNLIFFLRLVVRKKEYLKFMQVSVIVNGLICFPIMLKGVGYTFINYYYILAVFAGLCLVNKWYSVVIPLTIIIADGVILTTFTTGIEVPHPMKLAIGPTICFIIVFIIVYVFNQENMKDKQIIRDHEKSLELLAARDVLTNAYNRRMFDEDSKVKDFKYIVMIDIDHFKKVNDTYGHQAGDKVLKDLVDLLYDDRCYEFQLYRYGGEEFSIISMYEGNKTLELITKFINNVRETLTVGDGQKITVSCGVAKRLASQGLKYTIQAADDQLYLAKRNGRNAVYYDNAKIL